MCACINLLRSLETFTACPSWRRLHIAGAIKGKACELLEEADEVVGCLVVCELLCMGHCLCHLNRAWRWKQTCWPRQILGPALKGQKMYGFGVRYLCKRSSRKRLGSKTKAVDNYRAWVSVDTRKRRCAPSGPQRSVLLCILITVYAQLENINFQEIQEGIWADVQCISRNIYRLLVRIFGRPDCRFGWSPSVGIGIL